MTFDVGRLPLATLLLTGFVVGCAEDPAGVTRVENEPALEIFEDGASLAIELVKNDEVRAHLFAQSGSTEVELGVGDWIESMPDVVDTELPLSVQVEPLGEWLTDLWRTHDDPEFAGGAVALLALQQRCGTCHVGSNRTE